MLTFSSRSSSRRAGLVVQGARIVLFLLANTPAAAQGVPLGAERVPWPLIDFIVLGDSTHGIQLYASPNLHSEQGRHSPQTISITLEPIATRSWALEVAKLVDSVGTVPRKEQRPFGTAPLNANLGRGRVELWFETKAPRETPYVLSINGSSSSLPWSVRASATDLLLLITTLDAVAQGSAIDSLPSGEAGSPYLACQLDQLPEPLSHPALHYPEALERKGVEGRVWLQYIIDPAGTVRPGSILVLLTDGEDFTKAAVEAIEHSRFRPALYRGTPVSALAWQPITFRMDR